jgi:hypothetical protein
MLKEIVEVGYNYLDNFTTISSPSKDRFYANKIFFAYILLGLKENNLYKSLIKFIEDDNNSSMSEYAHKLALKYTILYCKISNNDLQLPFLNEKIEKQKVIEEMNMGFNLNLGINALNQGGAKIDEFDEEVANMKVKVMHLLDQTFYHFNCKDNASINVDTLSSEIIIAVNTCLNVDIIKKYDNQYFIDSCKKELFSKDDETYNQSLKNSKILDTKEYSILDWKYIDKILDIVDIKRELIMDLHKQKFFKKILFNFMPSKKILVKVPWLVTNFHYCSIGNKMFKILSTYSDLATILDSYPEDFLLKKSLTWLEDVMQCLENILGKSQIEEKDQPFYFRRIYNSVTRSIFSFIGILSQTTLGDDYLFKKKFYALLDKFVTSSNKYDHILTTIIDNLNFSSKNVINWILKLINKGSLKIKRYIFDHIRCLNKYGKDIKISVETMLQSLDKNNQETNEIIFDILKQYILEEKNIDAIITQSKNIIEKIYEIDKTFICILMRNQKSFDNISSFIDKEIKNINVDKIITDYSNELKESMNEVFEDSENSEEKYFLTINITKVENQYENYDEFYFLKQLPFNIFISVTNSDKKDDNTLITYMEYHKNNNIELCGVPSDTKNITIDPRKQMIQIKCGLGKSFLDNKTGKINNDQSNTGVTFNPNDMTNLVSNLNKKDIFSFYKNGVTFSIKKNKKDNNFTLFRVNLRVKINPSITKSVQTPINIITELNNNRVGLSKLIEKKIVEKILKYVDISNIETKSSKIKSALWILAKLLVKDNQRELDNIYKIVKKILDFNRQCNDYSLKGTIAYILSYISQNKNIKNILESNNYSYFFNTDICYPNDIREIYLNSKPNYINRKINEEADKISKLINLPAPIEEIYNNLLCLINGISFRQAMNELDETSKNKPKNFFDVNLLIKVYIILSKYKYKQLARRSILSYLEKAINSNDFAKDANKILKMVGNDVLTAHHLE